MDKESLGVIRDAISMNRRLKLSYWSFAKDESTERELDPYIIEIHEGCYHLIGYCHLRSAVRNLRISRIRKVEMLDEKFERPPDFYSDYKKNRFKYLAGEDRIHLKIKFSKEIARYIMEYEAQNADRIIRTQDGCAIFEKTTRFSYDVMRWVLGFGSNAEVLEPIALRTKIKDEVQRIHQIYSGLR